MVLAEELRGAHSRAQKNQRPVAVTFPSDGQTTPVAQGFYLLEGYEVPKLRRVVDLAGENPLAYLMVGVWPVSPSSNGINPVPIAEHAIDLDAWLPTQLQGDFSLVFLPSGRVQSTDLPMFAGAFHILVGSGLEFAPAGVDVQVQPHEHVTLEVTATDQDGDELFCLWTSDVGHFSSPEETRTVWDETSRTRRSVWTWQPPHDASVGDPFTLTCRVRDSSGAVAAPITGSVLSGLTEAERKIFYLRDSGAFRYAYTCKPDGTGERRLTEDDDAYSREVHTSLDSSRVVYCAKANGTGNFHIESSNVDGSDVEVVLSLPGTNLIWPRINPQGTHIIYNRGAQLWMVDADGSNQKQITTTPGNNHYVSWSADGRRIAWIWNQKAVKVMDLDPNNGFNPAGPETVVLPDPGGGQQYHYAEWQPSAVAPRLLVNRKQPGQAAVPFQQPALDSLSQNGPPVASPGSLPRRHHR